jgi:hypothetical protein
MADTTKDILLRVKTETDDANKDFKSLKDELRQIEKALNDMSNAGKAGSADFKKLQQRAGEVKDQIGDTKNAIKALSSDTFRLDAFSQAAQGIAGGFAAAQGAMALFGSENKAVEEAIKKTQGAMALLQGVTAITNILQKDSAFSLNFLGKAQKANAVATDVGTKATKGFSKALIATGVGALVVALGFLIANFEDVKTVVLNLMKPFDGIIAKVRDFLHTISFGLIDDASTAKTKENAEESLKAIEKVAKYNQSMEKQMQRSIDLAKAKGKSDKEVLKLEKELLDFRLKNNYAEQDAIKRKMALGTATDDEKKKLFELVESARDLVKDRELLDINYQKGVEKRNEEAKKKKQEDDQKEKDKEKKRYEESIKANETYFAHLIATAQLNDQETETLEIQKLEKQLEIEKKFGNDTTALADQIALKKKGIKDKELESKKELDDKEHQMDIDAQKTSFALAIDSDRLKIQKKKELAKQAYLDGIISEKEYQDTIAGLDTKAFQIKQNNINKWAKLTMDGLGALRDLNDAFAKKDEASQKKAFERNKKYSIAQALISTFLAVNGALTAGGNPAKLATGAQFVEAGIALATGLAQVAKISKTTFQGGSQSPSGGGGGGAGNIPAPSAMATTTPTIGSTQLQLDAQGNLQQQSVRTYVLETDISDKQKRSQRLQRTATLGK